MTSHQLMLIVSGVIIGTMGWLLYWAGLPAVGAIVGAGTGAALGYIATGVITQEWALIALPLVGLIVGGFIGFKLIRAFQIYFFFIAGASLGGALGFDMVKMPQIENLLGHPGQLGDFMFVGLFAILGGFLFVSFRRFIIALVTSVIGVFLLVQGLPEEHRPVATIVGLVVFLGIQIGLVRRFVNQETFDRRTRDRLRKESPYIPHDK